MLPGVEARAEAPYPTPLAPNELTVAARGQLTLRKDLRGGKVLGRGYSFDAESIVDANRRLIGAQGAVHDSKALRADLDLPDAGGDFAAGVIALEGSRLGGTGFTSFDRRAVRLLKSRGRPTRLLA